MQRSISRLFFTTMLLLMLSASFTAQIKEKKEKEKNAATLPAVIWRDPGDVASSNLFYGTGGKEHAPDPNGKFTFVAEDLQKTSPKFDIKDEQGVKWRVKLGQEPQSETAATRLLWAAGYFVDEDYYLASFKVTGLPKLKRGGEFVSPDGTVREARLERKPKEVGKLGNWDWFHNPYVGTRELNGLRVMMALMNNWDLKEENNTIRVIGGEPRYMVTDLGATFGRTGSRINRSKSVLKDYADSRFIDKVTAQKVDFVMHSRPPFVFAMMSFYHERAQMEEVTRSIPLADVKWITRILSQLSPEQIRDCFRAAGYTPEEVEGYAKVVQKRIADLNALNSIP